MGRLILFPIELIPMRYSFDWFYQIRRDCKEMGIEAIPVGNTTISTLKPAQWLDPIYTLKYKNSQISIFLNMVEKGQIKDDDTVFIFDLWFTGIEALAYIRSAKGMKFKIVGLLHAGTWDKCDFLHQKGFQKWSKGLEKTFVQIADKVIVATEFHKGLICDWLELSKPESHKIEISPWPILLPEVKRVEKENIVLFPHRLAPEKQPEVFDQVRALYEEKFNDRPKWIKTFDVIKDKYDFYNLANRAKVAFSSALQETFGIVMLECLNFGCHPIAPNRLSYPETLNKSYLYETIEEAVDEIHFHLTEYEQPEQRYELNNFKDILEISHG